MSKHTYTNFSDPTAGLAMSNLMREYREKQKAKSRREHEMMNRPKIYVCSPYSGDTKTNIAKAISYCRYVISKGGMPIASHIFYADSGIFEDSVPEERELGCMFGLALLSLCSEVYVFGETISPGMEREIHEAKKRHIPVRYIRRETDL